MKILLVVVIALISLQAYGGQYEREMDFMRQEKDGMPEDKICVVILHPTHTGVAWACFGTLTPVITLNSSKLTAKDISAVFLYTDRCSIHFKMSPYPVPSRDCAGIINQLDRKGEIK